jgi:hypothetical protein
MILLVVAIFVAGLFIASALVDRADGHWSGYCGHGVRVTKVHKVVFGEHVTVAGRHWHLYRHYVRTSADCSTGWRYKHKAVRVCPA